MNHSTGILRDVEGYGRHTETPTTAARRGLLDPGGQRGAGRGLAGLRRGFRELAETPPTDAEPLDNGNAPTAATESKRDTTAATAAHAGADP
jgi:hypothetical protein